MATATITYDGRNKTARSIMQMIRSLDIFTVTESQKESMDDPTLMSKEEYSAMLDKRKENYEKGEYVSFKSPEEMHSYLERL